jgi:lipopolysaccharide transport system ATP-binding protein
MPPAIKVENLSKAYRLGVIGTGTLANDLKRWYALAIGNEDPFLKIGEVNDRAVKGISDVVWSLKDINFEIEQSEAVGIIGRNGAGKSTLLKILSRVTSPTTGKISGNGRVASLLEVGTGFHPELTGKENIYLNGTILGMRKKEIKRKFDAIVDFAGVERYIDTPVKRYSSGMYVRLAFAVAAYLESEILIVDEVLAVGDAEFQKKCLGKMNQVSKSEGKTVLFVSHNMAAIQNLCSKTIVLDNGTLVYKGSTSTAIGSYVLKNSNVSGHVDYDHLRTGTGPIKIVSIELRDKQGNKLEKVYSGQDFDVMLKFECSKPLHNANIIPSIQISTRMEIPITLHHSRLNKKFFKEIGKAGYFIFSINKLPLVPDIYNISYSLQNDGTNLDSISNIKTLEVVEGDYYGSGEVPPTTHGIFLLNGNWTVKSHENEY